MMGVIIFWQFTLMNIEKIYTFLPSEQPQTFIPLISRILYYFHLNSLHYDHS